MFKEILTKDQIELLPFIKKFAKDYYLVGGTAIALHIGHRRSIDFDLFTQHNIKRKQIKNIIETSGYSITDVIFEASDQFHIIINGVKITFFQYPYNVKASFEFEQIIKTPSLLDLAAMKASAIGGRAKWKDYVDLYFILRKYYSIDELATRARELFKSFFNDKLFKEQLSYFDDIDHSEQVEFIGEQVPDEEIKNYLIQIATEKF